MHYIMMGILFGLSTSMPIGPVNLEIARRTIQLGFPYGTITGFGAVCADLIFMTAMSVGMLKYFSQGPILTWINMLGAGLIAYFGIKAFFSPVASIRSEIIKPKPLFNFFMGGLGMTLLNPLSILFWFSISTQLMSMSSENIYPLLLAAIGVLTGTGIWVLISNACYHFSRNFLKKSWMLWLNRISGIVLIGYATHNIVLLLNTK